MCSLFHSDPTETLTLTISPEVAEEGETVTISCSGDGNPAPEVSQPSLFFQLYFIFLLL